MHTIFFIRLIALRFQINVHVYLSLYDYFVPIEISEKCGKSQDQNVFPAKYVIFQDNTIILFVFLYVYLRVHDYYFQHFSSDFQKICLNLSGVTGKGCTRMNRVKYPYKRRQELKSFETDKVKFRSMVFDFLNLLQVEPLIQNVLKF